MTWQDALVRIAELAAVVLLAKWARNQLQPKCTCGCHDGEEEPSE